MSAKRSVPAIVVGNRDLQWPYRFSYLRADGRDEPGPDGYLSGDGPKRS